MRASVGDRIVVAGAVLGAPVATGRSSGSATHKAARRFWCDGRTLVENRCSSPAQMRTSTTSLLPQGRPSLDTAEPLSTPSARSHAADIAAPEEHPVHVKA